MGVPEVINALPLNKLIDTVSSAIGKVYEPRYIRKMAEAKAYEISTIASALKNNTEVPIKYNEQDGLSLDATDVSELIKRTEMRLGTQELIKQSNIENVILKAYQILEMETDVSAEPVELGWTVRFMNYVGEIDDEELQNIWAKLLSGEVKQPHSFSLRTLDVVKNLSRLEAELFEKIAVFIFDDCLSNDDNILKKYNIFYEDVLKLCECGLINSNSGICEILTIKKKQVIKSTQEFVFIVNPKDENEVEVSIPLYVLTEAGKALIKIIKPMQNNNFFIDYCKSIKSNNPGIDFSLYKIKERGEKGILTTGEDLLQDLDII